MNLMRFLLRSARGMVLLTALVAALSGACNAGLIALVNTALNRAGHAGSTLLWGFIALGLGKLLNNLLSQVLLIRFSQGLIARLRQDLVRKILTVPLRHLEEIGTPRLMVALTEDVLAITQALLGMPAFGVNVAILLGGAAYLTWLSWKVLLALCGFILCGFCGYRLLIRRGFHRLNLAREVEDHLFSHFRGLTEGIKELKLHRNRRRAFLSRNIQTTTDAYRRHNVAAELHFIIADNWSHLLFYSMIGFILFLLPLHDHITPQAMTGYIVTTLYLMGPLAGVMGSLSVFGRANVALQKVEQLGALLTAHATDESAVGLPEPPTTFKQLDLLGVTHSYHRESEDSHFVLGPIHLTFHAGEVVFLVGGNGSGKTTLAKLITGLYPPETGAIHLDGTPITNQNRDDYRQLFSAVFADFHLFDSLLGMETPNLDAQARHYLTQLHLHHKVKVRNGTLSTTALSQGQRKRLALLTAYLENRPFYLFDEWASDQDPLFKEIFYTQLLPELKARGKTVLVITHDDKYFHRADRFLKLDYGKLVHEDSAEAPLTEPELEVCHER
ncbi:MAG: cyclic peptide export ABC transporter [Verrucomicrobia bacterium]|nr:cyclic peptide export ABC transporter [Verrucomicrobiota bacterium]